LIRARNFPVGYGFAPFWSRAYLGVPLNLNMLINNSQLIYLKFILSWSYQQTIKKHFL